MDRGLSYPIDLEYNILKRKENMITSLQRHSTRDRRPASLHWLFWLVSDYDWDILKYSSSQILSIQKTCSLRCIPELFRFFLLSAFMHALFRLMHLNLFLSVILEFCTHFFEGERKCSRQSSFSGCTVFSHFPE